MFKIYRHVNYKLELVGITNNLKLAKQVAKKYTPSFIDGRGEHVE